MSVLLAGRHKKDPNLPRFPHFLRVPFLFPDLGCQAGHLSPTMRRRRRRLRWMIVKQAPYEYTDRALIFFSKHWP